MERKKALLIFPRNVLICYDLHIIDIYNRHKHRMEKWFADSLKEDIMNMVNGDPANSPLHKLIEIDGNLVLCDIISEEPSDYFSKNKFIYGKSVLLSNEIYARLVKENLSHLVSITPIEHRNINVPQSILDQYNNFIVYDNTYWDELSMLKGLYGESTQYIDRDKITEWMKDNSSHEEHKVLELTFVSDAFDIDTELSIEVYHKYGMDVARYIDSESRICCMNPDNHRRYTEELPKLKNMRYENRCSVALAKLWDNSFM